MELRILVEPVPVTLQISVIDFKKVTDNFERLLAEMAELGWIENDGWSWKYQGEE
jgi:hypothetical protein